MFEFKCFEYLKEIEENSQNETLKNEFKTFLIQNKDKIEQFIIQNSLKPSQKEILLHTMQEIDSNESQNTIQSYSQTSSIPQNSQNNDFSNIIMQTFEQWREEYFKLRDVTPKCISIAEEFVNTQLLQDKNLIDLFTVLPCENNDALRKFKNHVLNILAVDLIENINSELLLIKQGKGSFVKKMLLRYKLERVQLKIAKKQFNISYLEQLVQEAKVLRGQV